MTEIATTRRIYDTPVMNGDSVSSELALSRADAVTLDSVSYAYDGVTNVLQNLSLSVSRGEMVGIIGPSGCGKSTLLRLIAEFAKPRTGSVTTHLDQSLSGCPLSMMFQVDTALPWLTAEQNVLMFARFRRWRRSLQGVSLRDHGRQMLSLVHLESAAGLYPYQMSGGMKRRLAFATAVAPMPQILLLDEPFSSVDEPTRVKIHQDVFNIVRSLRLTTLLVTHDLAEALTLCDKIVILTRAPARVFAVHEVPFGDERDVMTLRDQPEFLEMYAKVWHDLSSQL